MRVKRPEKAVAKKTSAPVVELATRKRAEGDAYFTPGPLVQAIWSWIVRDGLLVTSPGFNCYNVLETSAGDGRFIEHSPLPGESAYVACDTTDYSRGAAYQHSNVHFVHGDFLSHDVQQQVLSMAPYDLIIGNPPYSLAEEFVRASLDLLANGGVLVQLLRTGFLESRKRIEFHASHQPNHVYFLSERPSFLAKESKRGGSVPVTDMASYGVFVWNGSDRHTFSIESWGGNKRDGGQEQEQSDV